jgi:hypothetical protein
MDVPIVLRQEQMQCLVEPDAGECRACGNDDRRGSVNMVRLTSSKPRRSQRAFHENDLRKE